MRIDVELTPADWRAYLRFIEWRRPLQRRLKWSTLIGGTAMALGTVLLALASDRAGWNLHLPSLLIGVAMVLAYLLILGRVNRAGGAIPQSFLEPQSFELREDGILATSPNGQALIRWQAVRDTQEYGDHLYLMLDAISALVFPLRDLEAHGGLGAVTGEIARLRTVATQSAVSAVAESAQPLLPPSPPGRDSDRRPALLRNLAGGLRSVLFLPLRSQDFRPSPRQAVVLVAIALMLWVLLDRISVEGPAFVSWLDIAVAVSAIAVFGALVALVAAPARSRGGMVTVLTAAAAASPYVVAIGVLIASLDNGAGWRRLIPLLIPLLAVVALYRAQRSASQDPPLVDAARSVVAVALTWWVVASILYFQPTFWYSTQGAGESTPEPGGVERELFGQADAIDRAVALVEPGRAGVTETFFVGFAGDGQQSIFDKEVRFARAAFNRHIALDGRSLLLINTPEPDHALPLATVSGLRRALEGIAGRMNTEEDVLVLFLTSHGDDTAHLTVAQAELPLDDLGGKDLREALDEAGIQWRIVVISACHSGSFIPYLEEPRTLIATAARADRSSFGCSDDRELTYYGEALLRDALPASQGLADALERARVIVREHENEQGIEGEEQSEPQVFIGERMRGKLGELVFAGAAGNPQP